MVSLLSQFPIVKSVLNVLEIIESYIEVATQLQAIGPEIVNKMVLFTQHL